MNIKKLYDKLLNDGGFTVNRHLETPENLYYIASYEGGLVYDLEGFTLGNLINAITKLNPEYHLIGAWIDTNTNSIYFDISINFKYKDDALKFAREQHQLAIYDSIKQESIYLE